MALDEGGEPVRLPEPEPLAPDGAVVRLPILQSTQIRLSKRGFDDVTIAEILAQPGESLSVDQPILRFA